MYQAHWGLSHSPFGSGLDRQRFFRSPTHDEALARLHFLVEEHRRLGLLLGGAGSGKSLVLEVFAHEVRRSGGEVLRLNLLGLAEHEFLWQLARTIGHNPGRSEPIFQLWQAITDRFSENRQQQLTTLLLLDDADEACPEVLEQVARLTQFDPTSDARLTVVLAAAGHRLPRLGQRLLSLTELRIDVQNWEPEDTACYVNQALLTAGRHEPAFDDMALLRLHELSLGIPRRVNQLADLSLLAAAGQGLYFIDEATVEAVCSELGIKEAYAPQF
jgi:general secretion pathway protein A